MPAVENAFPSANMNLCISPETLKHILLHKWERSVPRERERVGEIVDVRVNNLFHHLVRHCCLTSRRFLARTCWLTEAFL